MKKYKKKVRKVLMWKCIVLNGIVKRILYEKVMKKYEKSMTVKMYFKCNFCFLKETLYEKEYERSMYAKMKFFILN